MGCQRRPVHRPDLQRQFVEQVAGHFAVEVGVLDLAYAVRAQLDVVAGRDAVLCCASDFLTQASGQPSMSRIGRPEATAFWAVRIRLFTCPPSPAMHDISASPLRSSRTARWLASCAALEHPEHE